ncbi:MAG: hypothetical protein KGR26_15595, partial [Cyanobacteria bacterium REEB65]|nr:hypothetical protein [Cyanobacteria bacterium REEB65]
PTLVGGPVDSVSRGASRLLEEALEANISVKVGKSRYSIGRHALEQPFLFPVNDVDLFADDAPVNLALLLAALGLYARKRELEGTPRFKLGLAVPVFVSRRAGYAEAKVAEWLKIHRFEFCGQPLAVEIAQIAVLPRPLGAMYAATMERQLDPNPQELTAILDPGHLATDWLVVKPPKELARFSGHTTAAAGIRLPEAISDYLAMAGVSRIDPLAAMTAATTGRYVENGHEIAIPGDLTQELCELMAQQIAMTVKQVWRDLSIDNMLLVGGFGQILYPLLTQYSYLKDLQLANDCRYYNVKGAYEFAVRVEESEAAEVMEA